MKIVVESPRGKVTYSSPESAAEDILRWLKRGTALGAKCTSITVGVHQCDENCDHEVEA